MHGFAYTLRLIEPVLANSLGGDANSAQSLPFVPGAVMRGAVIQIYQEQHHLQSLDATAEDSRRLFLDGRTRYLHAYPLGDQERRTLPAPLSWHKRKNLDPARETKRQRELFDLSRKIEDPRAQLVRADGLISWSVGNSMVYPVRHDDQLNVHTQRDAIKGRATEENGAVFRYESLAAGQSLRGLILTKSKADADSLKQLLPVGRKIRLGKSRTAGYGLAVVEEVEELNSQWREASNTDFRDRARFTLTLLSEAIVRDERGQHTLDPLPALRRLLGGQIGIAAREDTPEQNIFRRAEIVGGFNRKWGMPLPQVAAIAAGSVFVIEADPPVGDDKLRELEQFGLGERRAEGFGRVAIDWCDEHIPRLGEALQAKNDRDDRAAVAMSTSERELAKQILIRRWRRELDNRLTEAIERSPISGEIPNSQLSRWRGVAHSALVQRTPLQRLNYLTKFLDDEQKKGSRAWEQLRRARINKQRLTDWIKDVLTKPDSPWRWMQNPPPPLLIGEKVNPTPPSFGDVQIDDEKVMELKIEYCIRLLDGVLARQAKHQAKERKSGRER